MTCNGCPSRALAGLPTPPASCTKGDRVYIEGSIKLDAWRGQDGVERHGLSVAAFRVEQTHQIGRNRPKRERNNKAAQRTNNSTAGEKPAPRNDFHDDQIPF